MKPNLKELNERLKEEHGTDIFGFFNCLRAKYINAEVAKEPKLKTYIEKVLQRPLEQIVPVPALSTSWRKSLEKFIRRNGMDWGDPMFHYNHRLTLPEEIIALFPHYNAKDLDNVVQQGYKLSINPLNIAINNRSLLNKFFPKADFFLEHSAKQTDPYGIFGKGELVIREGIYVGSQKFPRSLLMNITGLCDNGCVGCYKGEFTRTGGSSFFTDLGKTTTVQAQKLVEYLNDN